MTVDIEAVKAKAVAEALAADLQSPKTFNARAAVNQTTYPEDSVDVYADAKVAHHINILGNDAAKLRYQADLIKDTFIAEQQESGEHQSAVWEAYEGDGTEAPGWAAADEAAQVAENALAEAIPALRASMLTFHLRGLAPEQWRLIHKLGRKTIKEPVRKHFEKGEDGDEEFQAEVVERNIERAAWINNSCIASAIVKVTNVGGDEDTSVWTVEDVANLYGSYLESEYEKIKATMESLTFANNLFQNAVQQDADFLPKR